MRVFIFIGFVLFFLNIQPAYAEDKPFSFGAPAQQYANLGVTTGASFDPLGNGAYFGLEGSYIRAKHKLWTGVYTDAFYDIGQGAATVTAGPRLGVYALGIDGGLGLRIGAAEDTEIGFQVRTMLTFGWFSTYYRYGGWPGEDGLSSTHQTGLMIKMPFALSYDSRPINP